MGSLGSGSVTIPIYTSIWTGELTASTSTRCYYRLYCPNNVTPSCPPSDWSIPIPAVLKCPSYMEEEDFYTVYKGKKTCWGLGYKYGTEKPLDCR
jgi:hypothetical protein